MIDANVDIQQYLEETNQIKAQLGPLIDISNAPILKHALQDDDPSNLISKKMLQGYTLIDAICDNASCSGSIPLLRDKNGKLFCVVCDDNTNKPKEQKMDIDKVRRTSSDDDSSNSFDDADDEVAYSEYTKRRLAGGSKMPNFNAPSVAPSVPFGQAPYFAVPSFVPSNTFGSGAMTFGSGAMRNPNFGAPVGTSGFGFGFSNDSNFSNNNVNGTIPATNTGVSNNAVSILESKLQHTLNLLQNW